MSDKDNIKPYVTTYRGGNGYMAVMLQWYDDIQGYDVATTGTGRYVTQDEAITEAKEWAEDEEIEYRS